GQPAGRGLIGKIKGRHRSRMDIGEPKRGKEFATARRRISSCSCKACSLGVEEIARRSVSDKNNATAKQSGQLAAASNGLVIRVSHDNAEIVSREHATSVAQLDKKAFPSPRAFPHCGPASICAAQATSCRSRQLL